MSVERLSMPIGRAMFTQRSVRKFKPDPIPDADLKLIVEAAVKAPNGGNHQIGRFLLVTDRAQIGAFSALYREAWWAKRWDDHRWTKPEDIPPEEKNYRAAMAFADAIGDVPAIVFAFAVAPGWANSVIPACQNLMLAAHALGIGSIPTTLHAKVMERFYAMFGVPADVSFHFCIPLGYPAAAYGPSKRKPISETTYLNTWGAPAWV
jgi:nitroreductase